MPKELHSQLVHPLVAAPVVGVAVPLSNTATADATLVAFRASRKMQLIRATYHQSANAAAATSFTCQLQNATGPVAMTTALDIAALGADEGADFAGIVDGAASILQDGDHLDVVFNETGGTVTAPGLVSLYLEFLLLE